MSSYKNPWWWTAEHDSAWGRVKAAFKRDWDQTKHEFGGNPPDTNQKVGDTIKQALGKESIPPRGQPVFEASSLRIALVMARGCNTVKCFRDGPLSWRWN